MTKDEMKDRISMALKDPILQQGFEIICKENAELKEKSNNLVASSKTIISLSDEIENRTMEQLTKAKGIVQEYIRINLLPPIERNFDDEVKLFKQAEQFLQEVEE